MAQAGVLINIQILLPSERVRTVKLGLNEIQVSMWFFSKSELSQKVGKEKPSSGVLFFLLAFLGRASLGCVYWLLGCLQQIIDAVRSPLPGPWRVLLGFVCFFPEAWNHQGFFSNLSLYYLFLAKRALDAFSLFWRGEQQQWPYAGVEGRIRIPWFL